MSYIVDKSDRALKRPADKIGAALAGCEPSAKEIRPGHWQFHLTGCEKSNGKYQPAEGSLGLKLEREEATTVTMQHKDDWLMIDAPLANGASRFDHRALLELNSTLRGLSKIAVPRASGSPHLRSEIPLDEYVDIEARIQETVSGLNSALAMLDGDRTQSIEDRDLIKAPDLLSAPTGLRELLDETGWPYTERAEGKLIVDLDARNGFYRATIKQTAGGVHLSAELTGDRWLTSLANHALSSLLLRTSAIVRMARTSVIEREDQQAALVEINFSWRPSAAELKHALSAISVACELCGLEAKAIESETVARQYLASMGSHEASSDLKNVRR